MLAFYFGWRVCFFSSPVICSISFQVARLPRLQLCVVFLSCCRSKYFRHIFPSSWWFPSCVEDVFELKTGPSPCCCSQNVCWFFRCCFLFLFDWKERKSFFKHCNFLSRYFYDYYLPWELFEKWALPILFVTYPLKGLGILWHLYRPFEKMKKFISKISWRFCS